MRATSSLRSWCTARSLRWLGTSQSSTPGPVSTRGDAHARELAHDVGGREREPEQAIGALDAQRDARRRGRGVAARLDGTRRDRAARELGEQPRRAVGRARDPRAVDAALEAIRRLAVQPVPARGEPHRGRVEVRALDQHVGGRLGDLALGAAHHARDRDRALRVRDHEIGGVELARLAVERRDRLAGRRAPHADLAARDLREVERVQRLAELEHHRVGRVDHVVDRAEARRLEPRAQRRRRRPDAHAAHDPADVVEAVVARVDRDRDRVGRAGGPDSAASVGGSRSAPPNSARTSRATPSSDAVSPRFGVIPSSSTRSPTGAASGSAAPTRAPGSSTQIPASFGSSPSASSRREQIIPSRHDAAQLRLARSAVPSGSRAPGSATATFWPAATFGAPHTIVRGAPSPTSTRHTESRSAFGCRSQRVDAADGDRREIGADAPRRPRPRSRRHREAIGERAIARQIDELGEPRERQPHQICPSTRRSPSNRWRRCGIPNRRIAVRSMPMPNAKPW